MFAQSASLPDSGAEGSALLRLAFFGITTLLALLFIAGVYWSSIRTGIARSTAVRHAAVAALASGAWIAVTAVTARRGVLTFDGTPPTMILLLLVTLALVIGVAASSLGRRLALGVPVAALVAYQGFRVLVELAMHRAYNEGLMPVQMSYSGRNFDIISGVTALVVGFWLATGDRRNWRPLVFTWNTLGVVLLLNILVVALLSAPTKFRVFMNEPANTWITSAPWVWLPTVMVFAALLGHLLVYRRLRTA
ncbi:MAG TPA: hypothetical protein VFD64_15375 [Gemmatimonadaceae bacterium]|nr:hypothetical protein [Gemmatimonadaceae bacterium]